MIPAPEKLTLLERSASRFTRLLTQVKRTKRVDAPEFALQERRPQPSYVTNGIFGSISTNVYNHSSASLTEEQFTRNLMAVEHMREVERRFLYASGPTLDAMERFAAERGWASKVELQAPTRKERLLRWLEPKAAWVRRNFRPWAEGVATRLGWVGVGAGWGALVWSAL